MKRILLCVMNYRPEMISTGKYAFELAEYLGAAGHDVEVVTTAPHYPGWRVQPPYSNWRYYSEDLNGVHLWRCPMHLNTAATGLIRIIIPLTFAISSTPVLLWRALMKRPDVMIMVQPTLFTAPSFLMAAFLGRSKRLMHVQDLEIDAAFAVGHLKRNSKLLRFAYRLETFLLRRFDKIVTISNQMCAALAAKGVDQSRLSLVRNWVDTGAIAPLARPSRYRSDLEIPNDKFVVQYSGQMGRKQALHLIMAAARLLIDDPRFVFVLAGDGPVRPLIEQDARTLPNVRLLPLQPTEAMSEFLGLADCHILPQETDVSELVLPSKLGGMLASGKRMLITADRDSELFAFLGDGAVFVPPGDPSAIADALRHMVATPDKTADERHRLAQTIDTKIVLAKFEQEITALDA
jgi:colanic acid biosynthesis glycosyl transferase WcaI